MYSHPRRVVTSKNRKGNLLQSFGDQNLRIFFLEPLKNDADIVHLEAEVIEGRCKAGTPFQNGEADHTIADMPVVGLIEALCDSFHAEHGFVEARHSLLILGIQSEMSNFSRHNFSLLSERPSYWNSA